MYRVMRKRGKVFITVPFDLEREKNLIRAKLNKKGEVVHLLSPEYHGDPVNPEGGILCFQIFGWQFLDELKAVGFQKASAYFCWSLIHGFLGKDQMVIFAQK
ncbi:MAG: hypothetical protein NZM26_02405 [Patescibacteria group bacterium]|nr:hypothetical protein [Patescibacteria group bacterium]